MKNQILYKTKPFENIKDIIKNSVEKFGEKNAFIIKNKNGKEITYTNITYKEFYDDINYLGTALINRKLKGEKIAVIGKNRYEWVTSYLSVIDGVGIIVTLDRGLPEKEIEESLKRANVKAIIFENEFEEIIENIKSRNNTEIEQYICMDKNEKYINIPNLLEEGKRSIQEGNNGYENIVVDNDAVAEIVFTSGTTDMAKGVMLSHRNIASNISDMDGMLKIYDTDTNLAFLPFHHKFGSTGILVFLHGGATNVFCDGLRHIQENMVEYKVSCFVAVPLLLEAMYKKINAELKKQNKLELVNKMRKITNALLKVKIDIRRIVFKQVIDKLGGRLRLIISGASALDKEVSKAFNDFGIETIQGYGLTETAPVLCAENKKSIKFGSIGLPMKRVEIKIDNPNEDGIGELVVKGPNVMLGYYKNEEATRKVLKDGWFYTGDLGYIDKEGYIFITGREKNVIVLKNGKNVYPEEIETLISNLPYVSENMVFGMPKDDDYTVTAKIVYNKEFTDKKYPNKTEEEIKKIIWEDVKEINKTMPNYKHIKNIIVTDEPMIKTTTAKIKRKEEINKILSQNI